MARVDLKALAQLGAAARVAEITSELAAIHRAFPALRSRRQQPTTKDGAAAPRRRRRAPMSAAQKAAVSRRMKAYWAKRRKGE